MAFGGGLNDQEDVMSEINVTPLVDVMLVLLVIFILTVPVLTHSVKVDLPQTQKLNTAVDPKSISISVASDGSVYWNGKRIDKPRTAQSHRSIISDNRILNSSPFQPYLIHGSLRRRHAQLNLRALKSRSCRGGTAHISVAFSKRHLTVCSDIQI